MTLKEKLLNHFYELQNYYKNGIASEGEPEIIENLENDLKFVVDIIREIKSTQIGKANQVERLVITKIVEEVRFNINRLATKHFTENYEKTYLYANDVQNFSNDVRNAVLEILESNFSE